MKQRQQLALAAGIAVFAVTASACSAGGSAGTASPTTSMTSRTSTSSADSAKSPRATPPAASAAPPTVDPLTGGRRTGHPVIAVKLENTAAAMPQYGLSPADLVFVEQVEGSLTRLMPVYQSSYPSRVEPVRSARSTDVDILPAFGRPVLVYSGAALPVREKLSRAPVTLYGGKLRDSSRPAPHNLYFDVAELAKKRGLSGSKDVGLSFAAADPRLAHAPKQTNFTVQVGGDRFSFRYQGTHYAPSWNGRPYTDSGAGGKRVTASNVITLSVRTVSDHYRDPAGNPVFKSLTTGSGRLTLYRNGRKLSGTWHRSATNKPFRFTDSHGKELHLTPGKTWILLQG